MARTSISVAKLDSAGVQPSLAAANADGHSFGNNGEVFLMVENTNGSAASATVTIQAAIEEDDLTLPDKDVSIPAGETRLIGPFRRDVYNRRSGQTDSGMVYVDFSGTAVPDLQLQAFRLP